MRIALATGLLPVPPTYFALQHGELLQAEHEVRMFALAVSVDELLAHYAAVAAP